MSSQVQGKILARLHWQAADGKQLAYQIRSSVLTIGRASDCTVILLDTSISRHHARIDYDGKGFQIRDTGSANGVYVNGTRIASAPQPLQNGSHLRIGRVEMSFEVLPQEEPTLVMEVPAGVACLEVIKGWQKGLRFELTKPSLVLGRVGSSPDEVDIAIMDRAVSRQQARIVNQADTFVLTDMHSANGTLVNGNLIEAPHILKDGDAVELGETVLVFHAGST